MNQTVNANRLFYASCFALITTAFSFSIRAGILTQIGDELMLSATQLGTINQMWFLGFPIAMILGGIFYTAIGPKMIMQIAFVAHTLGIVMTIFSSSYEILLLSTLLIGVGNGCTEAACNPMIADSYSGNDFNKMLNRFHMWFPGGIVLGSLLSKVMTDIGFHWQQQIWFIMIPTIIYFVMFWGQSFPKPAKEASSLGANFKAMLNPLFLIIFALMALTAISEFGPQNWVGPILENAGASPMLILALATGVMAVGRYFGGPIVKKLNTTGVLLGSAIFAFAGLYLMTILDGSMLYLATVVYGLGICYFWPNMLGFVGENIPESGALGLSLVGGMGMFSSSIFQPIIGGWIDDAKVEVAAQGLEGAAADLAAGKVALSNMTTFPLILIVAFGILYVYMKRRQAA